MAVREGARGGGGGNLGAVRVAPARRGDRALRSLRDPARRRPGRRAGKGRDQEGPGHPAHGRQGHRRRGPGNATAPRGRRDRLRVRRPLGAGEAGRHLVQGRARGSRRHRRAGRRGPHGAAQCDLRHPPPHARIREARRSRACREASPGRHSPRHRAGKRGSEDRGTLLRRDRDLQPERQHGRQPAPAGIHRSEEGTGPGGRGRGQDSPRGPAPGCSRGPPERRQPAEGRPRPGTAHGGGPAAARRADPRRGRRGPGGHLRRHRGGRAPGHGGDPRLLRMGRDHQAGRPGARAARRPDLRGACRRRHQRGGHAARVHRGHGAARGKSSDRRSHGGRPGRSSRPATASRCCPSCSPRSS